MLKLERNVKDRHVSVSFRDRDDRFNRSFLAAFGIAAALHGLLFLLFQVSSFTIKESKGPFFLAVVEADMAQGSGSAVALNSSDDLLIDPLFQAAPLPLPLLASVPSYSVVSLEDQPGLGGTLFPFEEMEKEIYQPKFAPLSKSYAKAPVSLVISGPLAGRCYTPLVLSGAVPATSKQMSYSVLVEGKSGRIFWWEPLERSDEAAVAILQDIRFTPTPELLVTQGQIEVRFNGKEQK